MDLKSGEINSTGLIGELTFGNKRHLMFNRDTLYDINKGFKYAIIPHDTLRNSYWHFYPYFSPNDSNLMFSINYPKPYPIDLITNNFIFSLTDSSLIPIDSTVWPYPNYDGYGNLPQWSSDTSFVFAAGDSAIAEYFIRSRRIDTLVITHNYNSIVSFAYNTKYNIMAYSTTQGGIIPNISPLIYFHYKNSNTDSLAFSPVRDDLSCNSFGIAHTFLCWSPDNDRLGFFSFDPTNRMTTVYVYSLNLNRSYELTPCNDFGNKYFLKWANKDTLIYFDATQISIYGINLSNVDAIQVRKDYTLPSEFGLKNYPNPFNPNTTFEITLPNGKNAVLSIYNIQGKLIKEYRIKNDGRTKYRVTWNAVNNNNKGVASGFYLAVLNFENPKDQFIPTTKIIYLK